MSAAGSFVELPSRPPPSTATDASAPVACHRGFFPFASTALTGLSSPVLCLLGYLLLQTTMFDEEWPGFGRFRPRLALGGAALVVAGFRFLADRRRRAAPAAEHRVATTWLVALVAGGLFSTIWAFDVNIARKAQIDLTTTILGYFLLLAIVRTRREVVVTVLVLAVGWGLYLLRSFTEHLAGKYDFTMGVSRMMGAGRSLADPNSFAGSLAFSLPLIMWCGVRSHHLLLRACVVLYGLLAAYCMIQTHSRSGLALLALNVGFALWILPGRRARIAFAGVLLLFGAWLASVQTENAKNRYASMFSKETYTSESSAAGRIEGYKIAWRVFTTHPVTGVGPGCWSAYRMRRVDGSGLFPHNLGGQVIASTGLVGLIPFVGYICAVAAFAARVRRRRLGSVDPWDRAVCDLAIVVLFTVFLLLVSGLGAHNMDRFGWYLLPALLAVAARAEAPGNIVSSTAGRDRV